MRFLGLLVVDFVIGVKHCLLTGSVAMIGLVIGQYLGGAKRPFWVLDDLGTIGLIVRDSSVRGHGSLNTDERRETALSPKWETAPQRIPHDVN